MTFRVRVLVLCDKCETFIVGDSPTVEDAIARSTELGATMVTGERGYVRHVCAACRGKRPAPAPPPSGKPWGL